MLLIQDLLVMEKLLLAAHQLLIVQPLGSSVQERAVMNKDYSAMEGWPA